MKKFFWFILVLSLGLGSSFLCYPNSNAPPNNQLQLLLDKFRIVSQAPAAVMRGMLISSIAALAFLIDIRTG